MERLSRLRAQLAPSPTSSSSSSSSSSAPLPRTGNYTDEPVQGDYDYVVVGGGSAGAVVAARLAEDRTVRVLLLEAGPERDQLMVRFPVFYALLQLGALDWKFATVPQTRQDHRVSLWPRGRVLGGSSSINAMIYVRGDQRNYDNWARNGCDGWSYNDVLPYFMKSEDCQAPTADPRYHGRGGPLVVVNPPDNQPHELVHAFVAAGRELGLPARTDYNGPDQEGAYVAQSTIAGGERCDTGRAFLNEKTRAAHRDNLTVATLAHVTRILFQGDTAVGVAFRRGSTDPAVLRQRPVQVALARREVIVCGGAVNTPWLLQLSGIGPRTVLEPLGIPVVADLPVGENLQDHLNVWQSFPTLDRSPLLAQPLLIFGWAATYLWSRRGPLASCALEGTAFLYTGLRPREDGPDLQIHFAPAAINSAVTKANGLADASNFWANVETLMPRASVSMATTLLLPKSTGHIRIQSTDPFEYPEIQPNYLTDKDGYDVAVLMHGMKVARQFASTPAMRARLASDTEVPDSTIKHPPTSDDYLREYVRKGSVTVYHPVGTCKMGKADDPTTVVDARGRVKGVRNLRIADASIMPTIISGNTNAPSIMIGERIAAFLLEDLHRTRASL